MTGIGPERVIEAVCRAIGEQELVGRKSGPVLKGYPKATRVTQELPKGYPRDTQGNNRLATPEQYRSNGLATHCRYRGVTLNLRFLLRPPAGPRRACGRRRSGRPTCGSVR